MRFSGHESFACRYAWLPKALQALAAAPELFSDEDTAMVELGVGKNMVRSIRFWAEACGMVASGEEAGLRPTALGDRIFGKGGFDPFLEDITTLWLIHWKLSTAASLLAWDFLLNRWQEPEFSESRVLPALQKEVGALKRTASDVTLRQHLAIFVHTYVSSRARQGDISEDNLDCPLTELELFAKVAERDTAESGGRREPVYGFAREDKATISNALFAFCVNEFWVNRYPKEKTLPARTIANAHGSPGQIFKIPEQDVFQRLAEIASTTSNHIRYNDSEALPQLSRVSHISDDILLGNAYG